MWLLKRANGVGGAKQNKYLGVAAQNRKMGTKQNFGVAEEILIRA